MARGFNAAERAAIARGEFFTNAELAAKPHLRRLGVQFAQPGTGARSDPNERPMSAAQRRELDAMVAVCGYCHEPGDDRSALGNDGMHPECSEAWADEIANR